jgi:hypothetical protein
MMAGMQTATGGRSGGDAAAALSAEWVRLSHAPSLPRDRSQELLQALDRLPLSSWSSAPRERSLTATATLAALGLATERLNLRDRRLLEVTDQLLHRLLCDLSEWSPQSETELDALFEAWERLPASRRAPMTLALAALQDREAIVALERRASRELLRTNPDVSSLLSLMQRDSTQATRPRDLRLLGARLRARLGDVDGALTLLAQESSGCASCALAAADILDGAGRTDEASAWLLRATVGEEPMTIRQLIFDRAWARGARQEALEQQVAIIEASQDGAPWRGFRSLLEQQAPEFLPRAKELLRLRAPDAYMTVLLQEGPDEEIALCAQSKAFSAERLWEIAGLLQPRIPAEAAKLFERALQMQGVAAVTRVEMTAFLERVREVTPFFESLGRPTKAHRIARDAAAVSKCGAALKREYEHFFGSRL